MKPPSQIYVLDDDLLDEVEDENFPGGGGSCGCGCESAHLKRIKLN